MANKLSLRSEVIFCAAWHLEGKQLALSIDSNLYRQTYSTLPGPA